LALLLSKKKKKKRKKRSGKGKKRQSGRSALPPAVWMTIPSSATWAGRPLHHASDSVRPDRGKKRGGGGRRRGKIRRPAARFGSRAIPSVRVVDSRKEKEKKKRRGRRKRGEEGGKRSVGRPRAGTPQTAASVDYLSSHQLCRKKKKKKRGRGGGGGVGQPGC